MDTTATPTQFATARADHRITHAHHMPCGDYALELEPVSGGEMELALVEVVDRKGHDVGVWVTSCTGAEARAWLEDATNASRIAEACVLAAAEQTAALARLRAVG